MPVTTTIATRNGLLAALGTAQPGDIFVLSGGAYGALSLRGCEMTNPELQITIRGADPHQPAVFTALELSDITGLTLDGLTFDYRSGPQGGAMDHPFTLESCADITIRNSIFRGNINPDRPGLADNFGVGLWISACHAIRLRNNSISHFDRAIVGAALQDLVLCENDMHMIASIGLDLAHIDTALIEGNYLHDFSQLPTAIDPPDMIRLSASRQYSPSRNIMLRHNWLDIGHGCASRAIVACTEATTGKNAPAPLVCTGLSLERNMILNADFHGIMVDRAEDVTLHGNILLHAHRSEQPHDMGNIPRIILDPAATCVRIEENTCAAIDGLNGEHGQDSWALHHNNLISYDDLDLAAKRRDQLVATALSPETGLSPYFAKTTHDVTPDLPVLAPAVPKAPSVDLNVLVLRNKKTNQSRTTSALGAAAPSEQPSFTNALRPDYIRQALTSETCQIDMSVKATREDSAGELFRLKRAMIVSADYEGDLQVQILCSNGSIIELCSNAAQLCDMQEHDISIRIDPELCQIYIDGVLISHAEMSGQIRVPAEPEVLFTEHETSGFGTAPARFAITGEGQRKIKHNASPDTTTHLAYQLMSATGSNDGGLGDRFDFLGH